MLSCYQIFNPSARYLCIYTPNGRHIIIIYLVHLLYCTLAEAQPEPEPSSSSVMIGLSPSPDVVSSSTSSVAGGDATSNPALSPTATPGGSGSNSAPSNIAGICMCVSIMACMN